MQYRDIAFAVGFNAVVWGLFLYVFLTLGEL